MLKRALLALLIVTTPALADAPVVQNVAVNQSGGLWSFDVTIAHADTGWDHYADGWRILDNDGNELGLRVLAHPHVDEQPFTRSLSGIVVPEGVTEVGIQVRDSIGGWYPEIKTVPLR